MDRFLNKIVIILSYEPAIYETEKATQVAAISTVSDGLGEALS